MGSFEGGHYYLHYLHYSLASGQTIGRNHSPTYQKKIELKTYWAWPHPSEQDPVSPSVSLYHQEVSISLLSLSIRGPTEWKPQSQKTNPTDHIDLTQWNYEPCHVGPPQMDGSWWRVLRKCGPLEKGMAKHFSILAMRTPWTVWKGKKIWHWKMSTAGHKVSKMLLGKSGRELLITPERTKWVGQSGNDTQLWMCLVMKLKSNAVNTILHRKLEWKVHESR